MSDQRFSAARGFGERAFEIGDRAHWNDLRTQSEACAGGLEFAQDCAVSEVVGIAKHHHAGQPRHDALQQLDSFAAKLRGHHCHASNIPARMRERLDESSFDRVSGEPAHHDGNASSSLMRS